MHVSHATGSDHTSEAGQHEMLCLSTDNGTKTILMLYLKYAWITELCDTHTIHIYI